MLPLLLYASDGYDALIRRHTMLLPLSADADAAALRHAATLAHAVTLLLIHCRRY